MIKKPPYRIFRTKPGASVTLLQVRCPETGQAVEPYELEAYRARVKIDTPWHGLEKLPAGSRLLLTPKTARYMLAAGNLTTLEEPGLIISRESRAETGRSKLGGTEHGPQGTARA